MRGRDDTIGGLDRLHLHSKDLDVITLLARSLYHIAMGEVGISALRSAAENLAHKFNTTVKRDVERLGGKVYSGYSYVSDDDKAVAVVKFTQPWGSPPYRAVLVYGDMIKVKGGLRERVALTGYILSYLVLPDKAYSRLDIIKPRYKRKRPAKGVVVGFSRDNDGSGRGSIVLECVGAIGVFAEYRAKYVVFIPPIIAWRFSRWVKFEPRRLYELEGCKRIEREVAGEA